MYAASLVPRYQCSPLLHTSGHQGRQWERRERRHLPLERPHERPALMHATKEAIMDQLAAFRRSLAEAIAWCNALATIADPEQCLCTLTLQPGPLDDQQSFAE